MKKGWIITLGIVLLLGVGVFVYYNHLKNKARSEGGAYDDTLKPRLELSRFDISNITDEAVSLNMKLLIDNPLPIGFKASQVDYTLYIDNEEVAREAYDKVIEVKSQDSTLVSLPMKLLLKKTIGILKRLEEAGTDSTEYRIRTTFNADVPIAGERTFTVNKSMRAPIYHIPKIKVEDIDLGKLGLNQTDLAAKIAFTNKNKFGIDLTDTHYSVTINDKLIAEGDQPAPIHIKKEGTTSIVLPITVKPGQTLGLLPKLLFDKKDTPVEIVFRSKLLNKENNPSIQKSQYVTTIRGTLADMMGKKMKGK